MRTPLLLLAAALAAAASSASATKLASTTHDGSDVQALAAWDETLGAVAAGAKALPGRMKVAIVDRGEGSEWIGTATLGPLPLPAPVPAYTQTGPCTYTGPIKGLLVAPKIGAGAKNGTEDVLVPELTLPVNCTPASGRAAPWPVIFFYDGFSVSKLYEWMGHALEGSKGAGRGGRAPSRRFNGEKKPLAAGARAPGPHAARVQGRPQHALSSLPRSLSPPWCRRRRRPRRHTFSILQPPLLQPPPPTSLFLSLSCFSLSLSLSLSL